MESAPALIALPTARLITWTWRPEDGRLIVPNDADTALGAELAAALTQPDWGFVHPDDVAGLDTALQACLRDNEPIEKAVRVHPDLRSPVTWLEVHATCTNTPDGPQLRGAMLDGTRRRLAESARERQEARYRLIMDSAREYAILTMDRGGRITGWSVGAARAFGYTESEALGLAAAALFSPEDAAAGVPQQEIDRALSRGHSKDERWQVRKDGTRFFGSGLMMRMDGDDETSRLLKILRDRTLEEQSRTALAESQERLRLATDAAGLGVFEWNLETGTGLWENTRMYEIFGRHPEEGPLDAERVVARLVPGDLERLRMALQEHPDKDEPLHLVVGITDEDDATGRFLELWGRFGRDADGSRNRLIGVVADVTEQRRAQAALIEADRRKDAFLATLAHELRNPLAPIRHALEILRRAEHDPALTARTRTLMERQLSQMVRLIDDLLDLSRITLGKISLRHQIVSIDDMVRSAIETCQPILEAAGQRLDVQVPTENAHVLGDLTRLAQVLTNLLNNASKFSGSGQPIRLLVEASEFDVTCRVTDQGAGITPDELPTIFDMFAQGADRMQQARGGLGVGLALVRQLVTMHGGTVRAESAGRGKGSTFTFVLPRVPAPAVRTVADRRPETMQTMKRVLVVDDNADSAESLSLLLELMGHTVRTAHDGEEALEQAEAFRPELVLMDIGMPRMDGYEAARRLRQLPWAGGVVIVALTGWGQDEDKRKSEQAGFDRHLIKPVDPTALEALLGQTAQ